jgi:hypothetical protein
MSVVLNADDPAALRACDLAGDHCQHGSRDSHGAASARSTAGFAAAYASGSRRRTRPTCQRILRDSVMTFKQTAVRRAVPGDEAVLRRLRLDALTEAPEAFASTYARELARTTADWQRWLSPGITLILEEAGTPRGLVAGMHDADTLLTSALSERSKPSASQ